MKKILVAVLCILIFCGCSVGEQQNAYLSYFEPIVRELEVSWDELTSASYAVVIDNWREQGTQTGIYQDKIYISYLDGESYTFHLEEELAEAEDWGWQTAGAFYREGEERAYICLTDTNIYAAEDVRGVQILLLDYAVYKPSDYQVTLYPAAFPLQFTWVDDCYRLGDCIYIAAEDVLGEIRLAAREFRYCEEEYTALERYGRQEFPEESYHMYFFGAALKKDKVTVYSAEISEAYDVAPIGLVFAAFEDDKPVAYMSVDLRNMDVKQAIEVESMEHEN